MELDYMALGKNIRKFRILAEMTQGDLAEIAGCSDRHIGQVETAKNVPSLAMTVAIANALNVGIDRLVYGDLENRTDYFIQELASLTDGFEARDKLMSIELVKGIVAVLKEFRMK